MYYPECLYNYVGGFMESDSVLNFQSFYSCPQVKKGKTQSSCSVYPWENDDQLVQFRGFNA